MKGITHNCESNDDEPNSPAAETTPDAEVNVDGEVDTDVEPEVEAAGDASANDPDATPEATDAPEAETDTTQPSEAPSDTTPESPTDNAARDDGGFAGTLTGETLETLIDIPSGLLDESRVFIDESGIRLAKPDPANVAAAEVTLSTAAFDTYTGRDGELGVNLNDAGEIAGFYDKNDTISLEVTSEGKLQYDDGEMTFNQGLIDPDHIAEVPDLPEIDDTTTFTLTTEFLSRAVTAADMVSDHLRLSSTGDAITVDADGDTDNVTVTTEDDELIAAPDMEFSVLLSLEYMKTVANSLQGDTVTVEAGTEKPVFIRGDFADGDGSYEFMVAPRLEKDD